MQTSQLNPAFCGVPIADEGFCFLSEDRWHVFTDPRIGLVADALDGQNQVGRLKSGIPGLRPVDVQWALDVLESRTLIGEFGSFDFVPSHITGAAALESNGDATALTLDELCQSLAANVPRPSASNSLRLGSYYLSDLEVHVVLTDDYRRKELNQLDRSFRDRDQAWVLLRPFGSTAIIGPIFRPDAPGCWQCLRVRMDWHRPADAVARRRTGKIPPIPLSAGTYTSLSLTDSMRTELASFLCDEATELPYLVTVKGNSVPVRDYYVPRASCRRCGNPNRSARDVQGPEPIVFTGRSSFESGGLRSASIRATSKRLNPLNSKTCGFVDVTVDQLEDESYLAGTNLPFDGPWNTLGQVRFVTDNCAGGKGMTADMATTAAIAEGVERYCLFRRGDERYQSRSFVADPENSIDPRLVMNYSHRQYLERETDNTLDKGHPIPEPFDPNLELDWSPVWSPTNQEFRWLPSELIYFAWPGRRPQFVTDSNGCAAGNCLEEATLLGLLELIERDGAGIWWANRLRCPPIPRSVRRHVDRLDQPNREVWCLDLTTDIGVPTVAAISARRQPGAGNSDQIAISLAAGFTLGQAADLALAENLQQVRAMATAGPGSDRHEWWNRARLSDYQFLSPDSAALTAESKCDRIANSKDLTANLRHVIALTEAAAGTVYLADLSCAELPLSVVRVVCPTLRHYRNRFGPGRLYEVPVRVGRQERPTGEQDLNRLQIPL